MCWNDWKWRLLSRFIINHEILSSRVTRDSRMTVMFMGIFSRKKTEDKKEEVGKPAKIKEEKKKKPSMKELYEDKTIEKPKGIKEEKKIDKTTGEKKEELAKPGKKIRKYGNAYKILIKPLVTEKASMIGAENKYVFEVSQGANKIEIFKAVAEVYGIKPVSVNIIKVKGKNVRYGRTRGKKKDWKKAIITLPKGKSIKIYEGV